MAAFRLMVFLYLAVLGVIATLGVYVLVRGPTTSRAGLIAT